MEQSALSSDAASAGRAENFISQSVKQNVVRCFGDSCQLLNGGQMLEFLINAGTRPRLKQLRSRIAITFAPVTSGNEIVGGDQSILWR